MPLRLMVGFGIGWWHLVPAALLYLPGVEALIPCLHQHELVSCNSAEAGTYPSAVAFSTQGNLVEVLWLIVHL